MKAIVLLSGGVASTVLAYRVFREYTEDMELLTFYEGYDERLDAARRTAEKLDVPHEVMGVAQVRSLVANRNAILLNIGISVAVSRKANAVYSAIHAADDFVPDRRAMFIDQINDLQVVAVEGIRQDDLTVEAPFIFRTIEEIVEIGNELDVPWSDTWATVPPDVHAEQGSSGG